MKESSTRARDTIAVAACRTAALPLDPGRAPDNAPFRESALPGNGNEDVDRALRAMAARVQGLLADVQRLRGMVATALTENDRRPPLLRAAALAGRGRDPAAVSKKERAVLVQLLEGKSNREISHELGISEKTVKNHLWKIYRKLGVKSRTQLFHVIFSA